MKCSRYVLFVIVLAHVFTAHKAVADDPAYAYVQGVVGVLSADDAWTYRDAETGADLVGDQENLPYGGANVQMVLGFSDRLEYGFESGGLIAWDSSSRVLEADNNSVLIEVDNSLFIVELAFGGFVAWKPVSWLRLSVSAGPSLVWGSASTDDDAWAYIPDEDAPEIVYLPGSRERDLDVGVYARAGLEALFSEELILGVSAKRVNYDLDFGSDNGELAIDDWQFFLTIGAKIDL